MLGWLAKVLGDPNEKEMKRIQPLVDQINALEPKFVKLTDDQLRDKTAEFRGRYLAGESLDSMLPEAYAAVREAPKRTIGQRHFDVQLLGGIILHEGKIAEMKTGEGKTLVATLPLYLNALAGKGVHLVTVNDYLARRDAGWNGAIYHLLGLTVGVIVHDSAMLYDPEYTDAAATDARLTHLRPCTRREAYLADITYGTNNEFGFDYLRDNMVWDMAQCVQRELHYAIVDEVDNILIDEARTPLIISGQAEESTEHYYQFARLVPRLEAKFDYTLDEKLRVVSLTEAGISKMESWLKIPNLYDAANYGLTHYMENALKAEVLFKRDRDYLVKDGEVIIIDEFTGRLMYGRRYSEGLHQAIEAKEGVKIQNESQTLATITFQNYFRMYKKLAGMTGTAATEAEEFHKIYKLEVVTIPTYKPMIRQDLSDKVYKTETAKFRAVTDEIRELYQQKRPVLVGTVSVEKSEYLSDLLKRRGVPHQVLNAKYHEREALIVAGAGQPGSVTIATNMAGRGTDIVLGEGVRELGGLHIIGTERHEARRIDNQLRGRSGRLGDPGSTRFYVSLEDDLMRRFGGTGIAGLMDRFGMDENVPIEHGLVTRSIETAQTKVEGYNFDIRKHVVEYDDVVNTQRELIYRERLKALSLPTLRPTILEMLHDELADVVAGHTVGDYSSEWDLDALVQTVRTYIPLAENLSLESLAGQPRDVVSEHVSRLTEQQYDAREAEYGPQVMRQVERFVMLRTIDTLWIEHLTALDDLREGIGLRAYGQQDPLVQYKNEAYGMFQQLLGAIREGVSRTIFHIAVAREPQPVARQVSTNRDAEAATAGVPARRGDKKVGRNDPCPCGSGRKYKKCCGKA